MLTFSVNNLSDLLMQDDLVAAFLVHAFRCNVKPDGVLQIRFTNKLICIICRIKIRIKIPTCNFNFFKFFYFVIICSQFT